MQKFTLPIESRDSIGSSKCGVLRRKGFLPGILYAAHEQSTPVCVNKNEFIKLAQKATSSQLFTLKSENKNLDGRITLIKGIQKDYIKNSDPIHVDFMAIREDQELEIEVPLKFVGEPVGVKIGGGVLSVAMHEILVSCLPKNIPDRISLDVSGVELDQSLHASDIILPEGVTLAMEPDETIVSVVEIRVVEEAPVVEAAPAEGEAAAVAADGTTPAAGDAPAADAGKAGAAKAGGKEKEK